ncbi:MAG: hypothetical protein FWD69_09220 [Polyangiaceae bacterium]|nr:hypothetical protein [Polyangiaceae bacterium]
MATSILKNPFKPGAGHMPPYLAGRENERKSFEKLLLQTTVTDNFILTGLRGVGKTVLLDTFKPIAMKQKWLWAGADLSESASLTEERFAVRVLTDLSVITSSFQVPVIEGRKPIGFGSKSPSAQPLTYERLVDVYQTTAGLSADRLKAVLEYAWSVIEQSGVKGVIFAFDEAQNLTDHSDKSEFPMSVMLDVFQSIQRKGIPFMLALVGLPTLFPRLVEARTYAERMFHVEFLSRLTEDESRDAILHPIKKADCPVKLTEDLIQTIVETSGGYPYFIQFICREIFDAAIQKIGDGKPPVVLVGEITRKLDADFFAGRWARATDRQRELLEVIARLANADDEFTVQEIVEKSAETIEKPFSASHVNQMLATLSNVGLVYKNRHGKYSFAVPLLGRFILRQRESGSLGPLSI